MNLLHAILDKRLKARVISRSTADLRAVCRDTPPARDFFGALSCTNLPAVIAEIKFCSPSAGILRADHDVEFVAHSYEKNGAAALSVLTEKGSFCGDLSYIDRAKSAAALPVLRKDFLWDEYDILESRAAGADAVLIIAKLLSEGQIENLCGLASEVGLSVLLELHDESDLVKSDKVTNVILGVNHRDLDTLEINLDLSARLFPLMNGIKVAESGLRSREDLLLMRSRGADAVLIGTSFMCHSDPGAALARCLK